MGIHGRASLSYPHDKQRALTMTDSGDTRELTYLRAGGVSVVIDLASGTPSVLHWGADLGDLKPVGDLRAIVADAVGHSDFDRPVIAGVLRENARGFLGRPALAGHRHGRDWSPLLQIITASVSGNAVVSVSSDAAAGLEVTWQLRLTEQGVLLVDQSVRNTGSTPYQVDDLTTWLPLPDRADEVLDFTGRWCQERTPQRQPISVGHWSREVREGRTGHDSTIAQIALTGRTGFRSGEAWAVGLLWSGNTRHVIERLPIGRTSIGAGELLLPGELTLGAGETYAAPTVAATYSAHGLDGISDRYHSWLRARPNHPTNIRPRPLTLNVWEAVYFDHRLDRLSELADVAAEVGVERFVLDDGWFHARRDDLAGLGDWWVDPAVWPDGLGPLIEYVNARGMEFGLWFEPEMVNPDSDVFRAHPEWIFHVEGRTPPEWRHQQVLDLGHPEAYAHVRDQMHAVLSEYNIAYIKWDHNRVIVDGDHLGAAGVHRQTEAVYRLFDELKELHPGLEIESCASGGGRIDLGMAQHSDRFWTSDCNDALERVNIQRWTGIAIPPELLGTHIGPYHSHTTGRTHTLSFRAATALFGHAGIEWDITETNEVERAALASWIAYYKENRDLLHSGRVVRGDHSDPASVVHGVVSRDGSRGIFAHVQTRLSLASKPDRILLPGLEPDVLYRVREVQPAGAPDTQQIASPQWLTGATVSGQVLGSIGLQPSILRPENTTLIAVDRVDEEN